MNTFKFSCFLNLFSLEWNYRIVIQHCMEMTGITGNNHVFGTDY